MTIAWYSPIAASGWTNPDNAIDGNLGTYATIGSASVGWTSFITFTLPEDSEISKVRANVNASGTNRYSLSDMDVMIAGEWVEGCVIGTITGAATWFECSLGAPAIVTQARLRCYHIQAVSHWVHCNEFEFWGEYPIPKAAADTGAGVESLDITVDAAVVDSGEGAEALYTDHPFIADSGEGVESTAITVPISVEDSGVGVCGAAALLSGGVEGAWPADSPRNRPHTGKYYLAVQPWKVLFSGKITGWSDQMNLTYKEGNFPGTPLSGMTLIMTQDDGTQAKVRVKTAPSGATGSIVVAENDHMDWVYNKTVYILNRFELWPVHPRVTYNGGITVYKDYDIAYTDQNEKLYPVPIMGPPACGFLASGTVSIHFSGGLSHTPDIGVYPDIISWAWTFENGTPATYNGMGTSVAWTTPGVHLVTLTVVNTYGKSSTGHRYVYIYDRTGANAPYTRFTAQGLRGTLAAGGWSFEAEVWEDNISEQDFPEGTQVVLFAEEKWGAYDVQSAGYFSGRDNIKMVGWIESGSVQFNSETGSVRFRVVGIHALMKNCEVFSCALDYTAGSPTVWTEMKDMNAIRAYHHLIYWQSTLMKIVDVWLPGLLPGCSPPSRCPAAWLIMYQDFGRATLWAQLKGLSKDAFCSLAADRFSSFYIGRDPQSVENKYSTNISTWIELTKTDWHGEADIETRDEPVSSQVTLEGVYFDGSTATPRFSYAPGTIPVSRGKAKTYTGAILNTLELSNVLSGRLYAIENNAIPRASFKMVGNYGPCVDIAPFRWVRVTLASGDTPRNFVWDKKRFLVKSVSDNIAQAQGSCQTNIELEAYAFGGPGIGFEDKDVVIAETGVGTESLILGLPVAGYSAVSTLQASNFSLLSHIIKQPADIDGTIHIEGDGVYIGAAYNLELTYRDSPLPIGTPILWATALSYARNSYCYDPLPPGCARVSLLTIDVEGAVIGQQSRTIDTCWYEGIHPQTCTWGDAFWTWQCCPPTEAGVKRLRWMADLKEALQDRIRYLDWTGLFTVRYLGAGGFSRNLRYSGNGGDYPYDSHRFLYVPGLPDSGTWIPAVDDLTTVDAKFGYGFANQPVPGASHVRGGGRVLGLRFTGVLLTQGSSIGSARLYLATSCAGANFANRMTLRIFIHEHDNSPACSAADNPYKRVVDEECGDTSSDADPVNYVDWPLPGVGGYYSPDLAPLLQKIASRPGWVSGQAISLTLVPKFPEAPEDWHCDIGSTQITGSAPTATDGGECWYNATELGVVDAALEWSYGQYVSVEDSGVGTEGLLVT